MAKYTEQLKELIDGVKKAKNDFEPHQSLYYFKNVEEMYRENYQELRKFKQEMDTDERILLKQAKKELNKLHNKILIRDGKAPEKRRKKEIIEEQEHDVAQPINTQVTANKYAEDVKNLKTKVSEVLSRAEENYSQSSKIFQKLKNDLASGLEKLGSKPSPEDEKIYSKMDASFKEAHQKLDGLGTRIINWLYKLCNRFFERNDINYRFVIETPTKPLTDLNTATNDFKKLYQSGRAENSLNQTEETLEEREGRNMP